MTPESSRRESQPPTSVTEVQVERLLQFQRDALEMIVGGRPSDDILCGICLLVETMVPDSIALIMVLDESDKRLHMRTAPSLPPEAVAVIDGIEPGPDYGSCGAAVFSEEPVYVANMLTDPRWARLMDIAERFRMQACWSTPVRSLQQRVIGSFSLASFENQPPNLFQRRLLDTASYLAGIVLAQEVQDNRLKISATAFDNMAEAIMVTDAGQRILQVNRAFEDITGYTADEAIGQTPELLSSGHHEDPFFRRFFAELDDSGEWQGEIWNRRKNGEVYPLWLSVRAIRDNDGSIHRYVAVFEDITDTKNRENRIWQLAYHDPLSNLPNRMLVTIRLEQAIHQAHRSGGQVAVLLIDLDHFKHVNDSLGHRSGDELLRKIAQRLDATVDEDDTVGRLGGDEFVVLLTEIGDPNHARQSADALIQALSRPIQLDDKSITATASIGISIYPEDASDADELLQHADAAMYQAKTNGRSRLAFYAPELTVAAEHRLTLENDLRRGLDNNELEVYFQPQFKASDGSLVGLEALVRWQHPQRGTVLPTEFIPIAEETGLIRRIGNWVTRSACRQVMAWREAGAPPCTLSVNLSPYQLDAEYTQEVCTIFEETAFPPEWFEFEVTETLLVKEDGPSLQQLCEMRDRLGITFSMDDFGTGQSSLSQLKLLPISKLKIDRSFISDLPYDNNDAAIVRAVTLMAHTLGLRVVAEGVETRAQHRFLCDNGCDELQGFLYAQPMSIAEVSTLLAERRTAG